MDEGTLNLLNIFKDKTALVTGASGGIGKEIAIRLLEKGCKVILVSRKKKNLEDSFLNIKKYKKMYFFVIGDVTKISHIENIFVQSKKIDQKIDFLVCNVGNGQSEIPGNEYYEEWQRMLHINFFSTTNIIEKFKYEIAKTKGSIVCISSICGQEVISGAPITYSVAKAALNSYVKDRKSVV